MINIENFIHNLKLQDGIWKTLESEAISYPADGNNLYFDIEDQSFWFKNRNNIIYEAIKKFSINGPMFDVGGGNGIVANHLCNSGFETVLVEPGIDGCLNGKKRGLKNIVNSIFNTNYFYSDRIPNIGVFDVLEHIDNPANFLKMLHTMLIADGKLFVIVPALNGLWSKEDEAAGHFRRYSRIELCKLVVAQKFDLLYVTYFFSFFVLPIFLFRTIPSKIGFYKVDSQKIKKQHSVNSTESLLLGRLLKIELKKIKNDKTIPFGSSLLLVAKKK